MIVSIVALVVLYLSVNYFQAKHHPVSRVSNAYLQYHIDKLERFSFAGEPIPFNKKSKIKKFERELNRVACNSAETAMLLRKAEIWFPIIEPILAQNNIPDDFKYVAVAESGFDRKAVSYRGAVGFWQIIPGTATSLGLTINNEVDERLNAVKSTHAVCKSFQEAKTYFGSWTNSAAAFNMGMGALIKACKRHKSNSYHDLKLNRESSVYLYRILAYKEILEHPDKYKLKAARKSYNKHIQKVTITQTINNLVVFAAKHGTNYQAIKTYNPWIRRNSLTISKKNSSYELLLPYSNQKQTAKTKTVSKEVKG